MQFYSGRSGFYKIDYAYADNFLRPLERLLEIICLPALVDIRFRKPCLLLRLILLG